MRRTQEQIMELYDKYYDMVWRICLMQFGNAEDAYDAVQETFLRLMRNTKAFHDEEHEKAWLIRTAVNYCKDVLKSSYWKKKTNVESEEMEEKMQMPEEHTEVYEAMMELPEHYRVILYLHFYEGYSLKEISKMLKVNAS